MAAEPKNNSSISVPAPLAIGAAVIALAYVIAPLYDKSQRLQTQLDTTYTTIDKLRGFNGSK